MEVSLDDATNRLSEEFDSSLGELLFWGSDQEGLLVG